MTEPVRSSQPSPPAVTDHHQARLLTNPRSAAFIYPFLAREASTAQAANEVSCSITTMAYRVRVLREAGLLQETRTSPRAGRAVTYYRSSQDSYSVDLATTGFTDQRDQARRIGAPIYRRITDAYSQALAHSNTATRLITRDDDGGIHSTDRPPHHTRDGQPLLIEDRVLHLTLDQAEHLCAQLDRTLTELADAHQKDTRPAHTYAMIAAVPLTD